MFYCLWKPFRLFFRLLLYRAAPVPPDGRALKSNGKESNTMKKILSLLLTLCLILSLTSVAVLAAEGDPVEEPAAAAVTEEAPADDASAEEAAPGEKKSDLKSVFRSELYVKEDKDAGLAGDVKVDLDLLGSTGTLYLPGKVDASQLCFAWDDDLSGRGTHVSGTGREHGDHRGHEFGQGPRDRVLRWCQV